MIDNVLISWYNKNEENKLARKRSDVLLMAELNNVHDKFFKQVMGNKETAKNMMENYLPKKVLKLIDLEEMELEKDSMIEKELEETFTDLLCQ